MMKRKYVDRTGGDTCSEGAPGNGDASVEVHHVPFKVEYEGPASVDVKFTSKSVPSKTDSKVLINQFRGRPLHGTKFNLPENYEGLVAADLKRSEGGGREEDDDPAGSEESEIAITKHFDSLTYWNWDRVPSSMDKHVKLLDWIEVAQIVHGPDSD